MKLTCFADTLNFLFWHLAYPKPPKSDSITSPSKSLRCPRSGWNPGGGGASYQHLTVRPQVETGGGAVLYRLRLAPASRLRTSLRDWRRRHLTRRTLARWRYSCISFLEPYMWRISANSLKIQQTKFELVSHCDPCRPFRTEYLAISKLHFFVANKSTIIMKLNSNSHI